MNLKKVNLSLYLLNIINGDIKANYARIITDFLGKANQVVAKMKHFWVRAPDPDRTVVRLDSFVDQAGVFQTLIAALGSKSNWCRTLAFQPFRLPSPSSLLTAFCTVFAVS